LPLQSFCLPSFFPLPLSFPLLSPPPRPYFREAIWNYSQSGFLSKKFWSFLLSSPFLFFFLFSRRLPAYCPKGPHMPFFFKATLVVALPLFPFFFLFLLLIFAFIFAKNIFQSLGGFFLLFPPPPCSHGRLIGIMKMLFPLFFLSFPFFSPFLISARLLFSAAGATKVRRQGS